MSTIFVLKEGQKWGPYTAEELEGHVEEGTFASTDLVWSEGMDEWAPLEAVIIRVSNDWTTYLEEDGLHVTDQWVKLEEKSVPLGMISKANVQTEKVRRVKPIIGTVILGVILVVVPFLDIPRKNATEWIIWGAIYLGLVFWWLRFLYSAIRPARSLVVLDLKNGDERILQIRPHIAPAADEALHTAMANFQHT
jgi:hypothetical protein